MVPCSVTKDLLSKFSARMKVSGYGKGGYDIPLFVPHTPAEELVKRIRKKKAGSENNLGRKIRLKIAGRGGVTLEQKLIRSNPWRKMWPRRLLPI